MQLKKIKFILIQIDEAHSTAWPIGLENCPTPQKTYMERVERANKFVSKETPPEQFSVCIDEWSNTFANKFKAWPDKYYLIDNKLNILKKSEYGTSGNNDALIVEDCSLILTKLIN